jgi:hypothetical protein
MSPKDTAPKIFGITKKRRCSVKVAMENSFWVFQINTQQGLTVEHIIQFSKLWEMLAHVNLNHDAPDSIAWKFGKDGSYSASSAYKMQLLGKTYCMMPSMVWKPSTSPKCKIFTLCWSF